MKSRKPRSARTPPPTPNPTPTPPTPPPIPTTAPDESRAVDLLQQIKDGRVTGRNLSPEMRLAMVDLLVADGLSNPEIAKILGVGDRTIERDRHAIRRRRSVARNPALVGEMVGRLVSEAENSVQRIRRVTRDRETDAAVRIDGEHRCIQIQFDLVRALQSLGYLPTAAQRFEAQVTHTELPALDDLAVEIARLKSIPGAEIAPAMAELDGAFERALLASRVKEVTQALDGTEVIGDATA